MTPSSRFALVRWFLRSRFTRAQVLLSGLYVITIAHSTFWSLRFAGAEHRIAWMTTILPIVWPVWLIDESFRFEGPVRLYIVPRGRHGAVAVDYMVSRVLLAVVVGVFSVVVGLNLLVTSMPAAETMRLIAAAVVACVFVGALGTAIVTFVQGKLAILLLYVILFGVMVWEKSHSGALVQVVSSILPLWCVSLVGSAQVLQHEAWRLLIPIGATLGWSTLAGWQFRRQYR